MAGVGSRVSWWRGLVTVLAVVASGLVPVMVATATPAAAATATVGNGLTTTDLNAATMSAASLAQTLVGPGVSVSNVTFTGNQAQAGAIHIVDPAVVSFNDGVIFSSGNIADVVGPNKSDSTTGDMAGGADADLNALIANSKTVLPMTFDAMSLEFDFVPTASQVYFTYTFGSDEYLEWVNLFNDVFAFYVNGQNCATVPGGPVSIDTINDTVNPSLFRDNAFSTPPANPINIEPDGLSVELICSAAVNSGVTNHMKLAIADTSDQILDSVVMIKAHSLSTTKPESCNDGVDNDDDTLVDMADDSCTTSTTPAPSGSSGIGSSGSAPAFTGNEGQSGVLLDAEALGWTAASGTVSTSWTVTGINGTTGTCVVSPAENLAVGPGGAIQPVTAVCPDDGEYKARVDGWESMVSSGGSTFDKDVDFFVHNAPPVVTLDSLLPGDTVVLGTEVSLSATVTDPGANDSVTCSIDWGDGATSTGALTGDQCTASHAYHSTGAKAVAVTATDGSGDSAATAALVTVTGPPASLPSAVGSLTATAGAAKADLSWGAPADGGATITNYDVRYSTSNTMSVPVVVTGATSGSPAGTSYAASSLSAGTMYYFQARAVTSAGVGAWGPYVPASATPYTTPGVPTSQSAARQASQTVRVSFTAPATGGSAITDYDVEYSTSASFAAGTGTFVEGGTTTGSPIDVTGLTNGTAYYFRVRATNAAGDSAWSDVTNGAVPYTVPDAPVSPSATQQASQTVRVSFTAPATGGSAITDYDVEYSTSASFAAGTGTFVEGGTTTGSPIDVTGLANGTTFYFRIRATNVAGNSAWSVVTNGVAPQATAPDAPTGQSAARQASQTVRVSFTAPATGGSAITDYDVEYSTSASFAAGTGTFFEGGTTTAASVDVTGLTNGTTYYFRVRASNAVGNSGWSGITGGAAPYTTPGTPTGQSAARQASQTVRVSFTAPGDGGSAITDYDVEYSTSSNFAAGTGTFFEGSTTTTNFVDVTGLTNGTTYYFRVRATNAAGNSAWSAITAGAKPYTTPGAPTNVKAARATATSVKVSFTAPANGGSAITDYDVEYSTNSTFAAGTGTFFEGGTTTTTSVTVTGLTTGTTYYFRVRATNAAGDGVWSAISNSAKP